jgi:hypothetical protein
LIADVFIADVLTIIVVLAEKEAKLKVANALATAGATICRSPRRIQVQEGGSAGQEGNLAEH